MGLDLGALKKDNNNISSQGGDTVYVKKMKAGEEMGIRVITADPALHGLYYKKTEGYWIDKKRYISPSTFGESCEFEEEIEKALQSGDEDTIALCNKINNGDPQKKNYDYRFAALVFSDEDCTKIKDDKAKMVICGSTVIEGINKFALHKKYLPDITDREEGFNMFIDREGSGFSDTKYNVIADTGKTEQDPKYYKDVPNVSESIRKFMGTPEYRRAVIRQWLYGEEIPEEVKKNAFKSTEKVDSAPKKAKAKQVETPPKKKVREVEATKTEPEIPSKKKGGNLMDELEDVD